MNEIDDNWINPDLMKDLSPEDAQKVCCISLIGYVVAMFVGLLLCALFGSCRSHREVIENNDSVRVEVRTNTIYVPDTIFVEIPSQKAERTTADSTSHLENEYSLSDARINPDGTLFHLLETKPQKKPVEFQKPITTNDSIEVRYKTQTKTVEVEKKLSRWEKFKMDTGLAFISATIVLILFSLYILFFKRK
ncbi:MAG: hypothetical protein IJ640_09365 [Prevotella sp.]|nr:hypothetical protein [Prevotella sp.]